jgi:CRISPR-associated Csx2 family protein
MTSSRKLITFLGRGPYENGKRKPYRKAKYRFVTKSGATNWISPETAFFCHAAYLHQQHIEEGFDEVVILGTAGSMWDAIEEVFEHKSEAFENSWELMAHSVDQQCVTQEILYQYASQFEEKLKLVLITSAVDSSDQVSILDALCQHVQKDDQIWLDLTHGYRHLPMIGLASALLGSVANRSEIVEIYYGALEMTVNGVTPVISLSWTLRLIEVLSAMSVLDDYRLLRPLIDCFPKSKLRDTLEDASYKLDTMQINDAALAIDAAIKDIDSFDLHQSPELTPVLALLRQRLTELSRHSRTPLGMALLAEHSLKSDDFLRTSIYLAEAIDLVEDKSDNILSVHCDHAKKIRNWLAHGGGLGNKLGNAAVIEALAERKKLRNFLSNIIVQVKKELQKPK